MCSICESEFRKEIDLLIISGESARAIAKKYKLSQDTVRAHKKVCMARTDAAIASSISAAKSAVEPYQTTPQLIDSSAVQQTQIALLQSLVQDAHEVLMECKAQGDKRNYAPILNALIRTIEATLPKTGTAIQVNVGTAAVVDTAEWRAFTSVMRRHPELQAEMLEALNGPA